MSISTSDKDDKKEKFKKLREFHQATFNEKGVPDAFFIPKMAYKPVGKQEHYVGFFPSETGRGIDLYMEFCSRDNDPEFEDRGLYKWKYNPHFEEEYEKTEAMNGATNFRYLVPITELITVKTYTETETEKKQTNIVFDLPDSNVDLPMDQMTMRDLAAILLKKPISKKEWLNDIIKL
jgi:hypothetical protein